MLTRTNTSSFYLFAIDEKSFKTFSIGCEKNFGKTKHGSSGGSPTGHENL
jgi:hypothetical protein